MEEIIPLEEEEEEEEGFIQNLFIIKYNEVFEHEDAERRKVTKQEAKPINVKNKWFSSEGLKKFMQEENEERISNHN